jgi:hypothetical protein
MPELYGQPFKDDPSHLITLLRTRRERPRCRRAAEEGDEIAPSHVEHRFLRCQRSCSGDRRCRDGCRNPLERHIPPVHQYSLPQNARQVLGADLNCSESGGGRPLTATGPVSDGADMAGGKARLHSGS